MGNRLIINCLYEKKCFIRGLDKAFFFEIWCVSLHQVMQSLMAQNALTKGMTEGVLIR